jgi:hypothetical protein
MVTRFTEEMVQNVQRQIENLHREKPIWRDIFPVNPQGPPKVAHSLKYYVMQDVPDGQFFYVKQNAKVDENAVTGYKPETRDYIGLIRSWKIHANDMGVSQGRLRADSIIKITERMEKQIEKLLISGGKVSSRDEVGLLNFTGVQSGTAGVGASMTQIYNLVKELKDKLVDESFDDRSKWMFIHDATIDGYLDLLNSTTTVTAREKLISNNIIFPGRTRQTKNITPDTDDAAMALVEMDPSNYYVDEPTNGIKVGVYYNGALAQDHHFHGYLEWMGALVVVRPKAIAKNTGVASS